MARPGCSDADHISANLALIADFSCGDVVEVSPPLDPTGNTSMVAAMTMYEILRILAEAVAAQKETS